MESPNPFSKFQRKKLDGLLYQLERESPIAQSPLTVIVKRTMVKLPMSLLPLADPSCSDSSLITCSECNICVHRCKELRCASCFVTLYNYFVISLLWSWWWEWWGWQLDLSEMPSSSYEGWLLSVSAEGRSTQANRWWAVGTPHLCYGHPWSEPWGCPANAASYDRGYHQSYQENGTLF